jgi:hypothetical protein
VLYLPDDPISVHRIGFVLKFGYLFSSCSSSEGSSSLPSDIRWQVSSSLRGTTR